MLASSRVILPLLFATAVAAGCQQAPAASQPVAATPQAASQPSPARATAAPLTQEKQSSTDSDVEAQLEESALKATSPGGSQIQAAQAGGSVDALLGTAVKAAQQLKKGEKDGELLRPKIDVWRTKRDRHNANRCTATPDRPNACDAYNREADALNAERDRLKAASDRIEAQKAAATAQLKRLRPQLKFAAMTEYCARCFGLPAGQAEACWYSCFDGTSADPRIRNCLGISDMSAFAACLIR